MTTEEIKKDEVVLTPPKIEEKKPILDRGEKKQKKEKPSKPEYTIKKFEFGAVIPVQQYGNLQPKIELEVESLDKGTEIAMGYLGKLWKDYGEKGGIDKKNTSVSVELSSFNEPDIKVNFDALNHEYFYKGNKLIGATTFIKRFYKEFDSKAIAKVCAKSWEVEEKDILSMWDKNGDLASNLGTLVDNALEHYNKFFEMGEKIKAKNGKDNPAMPKHPLLKTIIEAFHALPHTEGQIQHQVFITDVESGYCGLADRLVITGEKKCRIQDFKVQIDSDKEDKNSKPLAPFDILPATKLTKYQLQMSFYANMLQKSNWTVEGLDAFVYEDIWKIYPLDVIKVI